MTDGSPFTIGVISDTHGTLSGVVFDIFSDVDQILHAGDVQDEQILDELEAIAPVHAVCGNVDFGPTRRMPQKWQGTLAGLKIGMTHGHLLNPRHYNESAIEMFADFAPRVIIHGHSHIAKNEQCNGVTILNPGAACRPRFSTSASVAILRIPSPERFEIEFREIPWHPT